MAEKKNDVIENVEEVVETKAESVEAKSYIDPFASQREQDEKGIEREGDSTIFKGEVIGVYLSKRRPPDSNYNNYAIGFELDSFGVKAQMRVNMEPVIGGSEIHKILDGMYGEENFLPLDIVKTISSMNGKKQIIYTGQIVKENEKGVPFVIAFRTRVWPNNSAASRSERELFNTFIEYLKSEGDIT